jgi:imidazolonepropionase-like amidohydrolase
VSAAPPLPATTGDRRLWLRVGTLLDGASTAPVKDAHVVYDATTIHFVGRAGETPPPGVLRPAQRAPDAEAPDATLLPGLIEAHAHLFLEGGETDLGKRAAQLQASPAELLAGASGRLEKLVRLGVVAVRDAGDRHGVGLALSRRYAQAGRPLMPYVDSPGAAIHHRGRYGSFMAEPSEDFASPEACVEARIRAGAARIKLIATGIIDFKKGRVTSAPQMTAPEIAAYVAAARRHGRQSFAHASGDAGIDPVIAGGVDSVEHGYFIRDDQLARMRDRQIAWVPTFAPVQKQIDHAAALGWDATVVAHLRGILERHAASLTRAHTLGVLVIAGSDAGSFAVAHGHGLLDELELMERGGLPAIAVINAATGTGAARLGFGERFGRIAPGGRSRFILTRHSPLATVANLRRPRVVIYDGQVLECDGTAGDKGL